MRSRNVHVTVSACVRLCVAALDCGGRGGKRVAVTRLVDITVAHLDLPPAFQQFLRIGKIARLRWLGGLDPGEFSLQHIVGTRTVVLGRRSAAA
jgi:hypothetical protein